MNAYRSPSPPDDSEEKREIADFRYAMGDNESPWGTLAITTYVCGWCTVAFLLPEFGRFILPRIVASFFLALFEVERCKRRVIYDKPALDGRAFVAIGCAICNLPAIVPFNEPTWLYAIRVASFGIYYLSVATYVFVRWRAKGSLTAALSTRP